MKARSPAAAAPSHVSERATRWGDGRPGERDSDAPWQREWGGHVGPWPWEGRSGDCRGPTPWRPLAPPSAIPRDGRPRPAPSRRLFFFFPSFFSSFFSFFCFGIVLERGRFYRARTGLLGFLVFCESAAAAQTGSLHLLFAHGKGNGVLRAARVRQRARPGEGKLGGRATRGGHGGRLALRCGGGLMFAVFAVSAVRVRMVAGKGVEEDLAAACVREA